MTDFVIPCDAIARMSHILAGVPADADTHFRTIRVENGMVIASNRKTLVVELIGGNVGAMNLIVDTALLAQCVTEATFGSTLTVTVNEVLQFAAAKTTLGYSHPSNVALFSPNVSDMSRWREVVEKVRNPAPVAKGGMVWNAEVIAALGRAAPTGALVFEEVIDLERPVLVRDLRDPNWFGIFQPFLEDETLFEPALLPSWF